MTPEPCSVPPRVGIMQGRLLPPWNGRFQAFPPDGWRLEFPRARAAGLDCIEWIYEVPNEEMNPLGSDAGQAEMKTLIDETGVAVRSVCADYYMTACLVDGDGLPVEAHLRHLDRLIGRAGAFGIRYIVLPFVDSSSARALPSRDGLVAALRRALPAARAAGVELHLETDLPPAAAAAVLATINDPLVRANYDIGNSAALGFAPAEELAILAPWLGSVHVKDRLRGGGTVPLGTGDADFVTCFRMIRRAGFDRWFILQAARAPLAPLMADGAPWDEVALARHNRTFVEAAAAAAAQEVLP